MYGHHRSRSSLASRILTNTISKPGFLFFVGGKGLRREVPLWTPLKDDFSNFGARGLGSLGDKGEAR